MKKSLLYRLFRIGAVPAKTRAALEREGVRVQDEGITGWFVTKDVDGPGKRYRNRTEGFIGFFAITKARVLCYTFGKRQINIAVDDPKLANLCVESPGADELRVSFESSHFREGWRGVIEFRFKTEKAKSFLEALLESGAQAGPATDEGIETRG
jgi:hypothetical protein